MGKGSCLTGKDQTCMCEMHTVLLPQGVERELPSEHQGACPVEPLISRGPNVTERPRMGTHVHGARSRAGRCQVGAIEALYAPHTLGWGQGPSPLGIWTVKLWQ